MAYGAVNFTGGVRHFAADRGWPKKFFSDGGTQIRGAANELRKIWEENFNLAQVRQLGRQHGFEWVFTPANVPWRQGKVEALIKSVKRSMLAAVGTTVLSVSELTTVAKEVAQLLNHWPIAAVPQEGSGLEVLTPNHMMLGRCTAEIPHISHHTSGLLKRMKLIKDIVKSFWDRWLPEAMQALLFRQKWHGDKRNLAVGDMVLVANNNAVRGCYKLGQVAKDRPDSKGRVCTVDLRHKNIPESEPLWQYTGKKDAVISRPVQQLVLVVPLEGVEDSDEF